MKLLKNFPSFLNSCEISIYEKSLYLKAIQKKKLKVHKIKWIKSLDKINKNPIIFIANEFFDALPIKQYLKIKNNWMERHVDILDKKKFKFLIKKLI